ncbi:protein phosphatase 1K, mitochondrial-like [Tigriopus californicus]|uniref:protein phosphatase 1K, mitochondrial-like n=1 Tax=Tigriopus californicus TaxID=6832 RepID=UPI0027DA5149|nr:protein phosphatase 1K, mitochondrial-like [Tigriopus californicus]
MALRHLLRNTSSRQGLSDLRNVPEPWSVLVRRDVSSSGQSRDRNGGNRSDKTKELDSLGTWNTRLDLPFMEESSVRRGTIIPGIDIQSVGVASSKGRRIYQEDRHTVVEPHPNHLLLAVWDGHGGDECSEFCSNQVVGHVMRYLETAQESQRTDLSLVLRNVVRDLQTSFEKHWSMRNSAKSRSPGTTATIALIRDGYELVVAQVGDSRAILNRDGEVRTLTKDHCPSDPQEKARIELAGGTVSYDTIGRYMVNHRLAMSRSIGDLDLKPFGVTAEPDIIRMNFKHRKDIYLVLTTDGVNFVMSDEEVVDCVNQGDNPQESAKKLVDQALLYASEDNITAIVVPLGSWGKNIAGKTSVFYSLGRSMSLSSRFS